MILNDSLIFDLDGTLWQACASTAKGWNQAIADLQIPSRVITAYDIQQVAGNPYDICVKKVFPNINSKDLTSLIETLQKYEQKILWHEGGNLYQDVFAGIEKLAQKYQLYIVSNCQKWYLEAFFKFYDIRPHLKDWNCHGMSGQSKSKMIIELINRHNIANPIYIGDTEGDEKASLEVGIDFIFMSYGFGKCSKPLHTFDSFAQLVEWAMH